MRLIEGQRQRQYDGYQKGFFSKRNIKINFETFDWWLHIIPNTCSRGHPERTSWINLPGMSFNTRLAERLDFISGHLQDVELGRSEDGQIGSLGGALLTLERDVLETCWETIFSGFADTSKNSWNALVIAIPFFCLLKEQTMFIFYKHQQLVIKNKFL